MRKIFLAALALIVLTIGSVAGAQPNYNFVRVSDLGAQAFVEKLTTTRTYQNLRQQGNVFAFVSPVRRQDLDDQQNLPGLSVYKSDFGIRGAQNSDGQIRFYVDAQGCVFVLQVINEGNPQVSGAVLVMTLEALGLNDQEGNILLMTQSPVAETWCTNAGRKIIRRVADQQGNNVYLFGASN